MRKRLVAVDFDTDVAEMKDLYFNRMYSYKQIEIAFNFAYTYNEIEQILLEAIRGECYE